MTHDLDLLVAGGGPVGLATAVHAARAGMRVAVAEPRGGAVDKACGEGLMPAAVAQLRALGVDPPGRLFRGIAYLSAGGEARATFRGEPGRGVRRTTLSAALAAAADAAGVERVTGAVHDLEQREGGVRALGRRARWLVAADGLHSPLRRRLGLDAPADGGARFGLRQHYRVQPWDDHVQVHWAREAEVYVTPVDDELVGVAVLCGRGRSYAEWCGEFPGLRERLAPAEPAGPVRGAGPLRQRSRQRVAGRVLLVGDAAGYVDALTGEGLAVGLAGAQAAVECLLRDRPQDYEREWRRVTRSYRLLTGGLLWASQQPVVRPRIVPAARRLPRVFGGLVHLAAG